MSKTHPFWLHGAVPSVALSTGNVIGLRPGVDTWPALDDGGPMGPPWVGGDAIAVEPLSHAGAAVHLEAWRGLADVALEPNVFHEPDFLLTAAQHTPIAHRPEFILVWDEAQGRRGQIIGVFPVAVRGGVFRGSLTSLWHHTQAPFGAPLLHRAKAMAALDGLFAWLASERRSVRGVMFPLLAMQSQTATLLRSSALRANREIRLFDMHGRAMLSSGEQPSAYLADAVGSKKLKDLRRLHRRLVERGDVLYRSARTVAEVRAATERYLALESGGWKGRRGTALLQDPSLAAFTRTMTRLLARDGKCRIDSLEVDGVPIAMGIVLRSGDRAFFWKTSYDETFSDYSPGVQLALHLSCDQLADTTLAFTDSCAVADHPMIDRIWRERLAMVDILVSVDPEGGRAFLGAASREQRRRSLREGAKRVFRRLVDARHS